MIKQISFFGALVLLILVQSPFVFSYSCDDVSSVNYQACLEIANSDLNASDKQMLISNLEYNNKFEPDHFFVYSNNLDLNISKVPEGVQVYSSNYINNAWMKIFTLMPSVIYNNSIYVPSTTKLLTGFHYDLVTPTDYKSPGYSKTQNGDCKTTNILLAKIEENKVYVNGIYQGQGQLVPITVNQDSKVEAVYSFLIKYDINHYKWRKYCCKKVNGVCTKYCYSCDYKTDETKVGQVIIKDSIDVKAYKNNLVAQISEITQMPYSNKLRLNYSDSLEVSFINSDYTYYKYLFELVYSIPPYNILSLKAIDYGAESSQNLFRQNDSLIVKNLEECKINGFDFFNKIESNCPVKNSFVGLKITPDKFVYSNGEEISVKIFPSNVSVNLSYANNSYLAKGEKTIEDNQNRKNRPKIGKKKGLFTKAMRIILTTRRLMVKRKAEVIRFNFLKLI